jgi:hypothetical protein
MHAKLLVPVLAALAFPAAAHAGPPNDDVADAQRIATVPAQVTGTTEGASIAKFEPAPRCSTAKGVVWFEVRPPRRGAMVVRLRARGKLDAALSVYHHVRSNVSGVLCRRTNGRGRAAVAFYAAGNGTYLLSVARRRGSVAGTFALTVLAAETPARPPGEPLPAGGIRSTLDPVLDASDAWSVEMTRGTMYRFNVAAASCVSFQVYRAGVYSFSTAQPLVELECGRYTTFTPGADGGGRYTIRLAAHGDAPRTVHYLLTFAPAGTDDGAPGRALANGETLADRISGRGIDNVDVYRFAVPRDDEQTTIDFREKPTTDLDVLLLTEDGRRLRCACETSGRQRLREQLKAGHYYVAVRSRQGSGGPYSIALLIRDITATSILASGSTFLQIPPGVPVTLSVRVTSAHDGGPLALSIDRFDPLAGWQFSTLYRQRVGPDGLYTVAWTPPYAGHWRAHARFFGTRFSSFSESGWVRIYVAEPLA